MKPSDVRARVLADHARLREHLDEIDALRERFQRGDEQVGGSLREHGVALYEIFAAHLSLEDRYLVPALADHADHGRRLADQLHREHTEQRELILYLLGRLEQVGPTVLVARELESFGEYLRSDMAHEEATILEGDLLAG